jgi:DNA-binding SARP family transcriptional activator
MATREQASNGSSTFCILGPLVVNPPHGPPIPIGPPLHRAALACLLVRAGQPCPRAWLADALWGAQPPRSPAAALRTCVKELRQALGHDLRGRLRTCRGGFMLAASPGDVDVQMFQALDESGRLAWDSGDTTAAARLLGQALSLWREPPLAELPGTPLMAAERSRLLRLRAGTQQTWLDTQVELGRYRDAIPQLWALAREHPPREHVWAQLVTALSRCGDNAQAIHAYSAAKAALAEAYGVGPGPELSEAHQRIMAVAGHPGHPDPGWDRPCGPVPPGCRPLR